MLSETKSKCRVDLDLLLTRSVNLLPGMERRLKKHRNKRRSNVVSANFERRKRSHSEPYRVIPSTIPVKTLTRAQNDYRKSIERNRITFGLGPAGTGKTYVAVTMAVNALLEKSIEKIVITRPVVEAGESLGFLPGKLNEKFAPYLAPMRNVFVARLGKSHYEGMLKSGRIVPYPLAHMRGESFDDCFIIADEAQNMTGGQLKMVLTRIGYQSKLVIDGDPDQIDLGCGSGLLDTVKRVESIPGINVVRFKNCDVVRSDIVSDILKAYQKPL